MNTLPTAPVGSPPDPATSDSRWEGQMADGLGATYGLPPQCFLSATASELVLSGPLGKFHLPRSAVLKLGRGRMYPWFFSGIRIHHRHPGYPEELQFKASGVGTRDILSRLRALGYPVA